MKKIHISVFALSVFVSFITTQTTASLAPCSEQENTLLARCYKKLKESAPLAKFQYLGRQEYPAPYAAIEEAIPLKNRRGVTFFIFSPTSSIVGLDKLHFVNTANGQTAIMLFVPKDALTQLTSERLNKHLVPYAKLVLLVRKFATYQAWGEEIDKNVLLAAFLLAPILFVKCISMEWAKKHQVLFGAGCVLFQVVASKSARTLAQAALGLPPVKTGKTLLKSFTEASQCAFILEQACALETNAAK